MFTPLFFALEHNMVAASIYLLQLPSIDLSLRSDRSDQTVLHILGLKTTNATSELAKCALFYCQSQLDIICTQPHPLECIFATCDENRLLSDYFTKNYLTQKLPPCVSNPFLLACWSGNTAFVKEILANPGFTCETKYIDVLNDIVSFRMPGYFVKNAVESEDCELLENNNAVLPFPENDEEAKVVINHVWIPGCNALTVAVISQKMDVVETLLTYLLKH